MPPEIETQQPAQLIYRELDQMGRRIDGIENRIQTLDEHGSRGLDGLRVQMTELIKDITELQTELRRVRANRWIGMAAYISGLIPIYVFVVDQLLRS